MFSDAIRLLLRLVAVTVPALTLAGCASGPRAHPQDPLEPVNRQVYRFNSTVDTFVLKPAATAYVGTVPGLMRQGVNNFFNNLQDAWSVVNNALQLKGVATGESFMRVGVNTLFGLGGVLDVADEMRIERHTEDFGQTLGAWGVPAGPYVVLPLLGPSTLRDALAVPVDMQGDPSGSLSDVSTRNTVKAIQLVDKRATLLPTTAMIDQVAIDKYAFIRDAHLQARLNAVLDGRMPEDSAPAATEGAP